MVSSVRTVLGDVRPEDLDVCDAHGHLFISSPQLRGRELNDATAARAESEAFRAAGGASVVQWTPVGMGRRAADLPLLSRAAGVHVVCATGLHQVAHYTLELPDELRGRLADVFVSCQPDGHEGC